MNRQEIVNSLLNKLESSTSKFEALNKIDSCVMGYDFDISLLSDLVNNYMNDTVDNYLLDLTSKIILIITEGNPLITLKIILTNIFANKKIIIFPNNSFIGINKLLVHLYLETIKEYDLKGEIYLEEQDSIDKYIKVQEKIDEVLVIGENELFEMFKYDFKFSKYIEEK